MTPEQICVAAMGICSDYTDNYPTTRAIMYQRISSRQRELFAHVAILDPEFYGAEIVAEVTDGALNVAALEQSGDVYPVERVEEVQVEDPGTSGLDAGTRVGLVLVTDPEAALPPRATYRSGVIRQVGTELQGVASLLLYYSRRPRTIGPDGSGVIELLEPFQFLLVYDLAKDLIRRTIGIEGEKKAAAFQLLDSAEKELLEALGEHITHAARARESRFVGAA
jgi:hypothetical protein